VSLADALAMGTSARNLILLDLVLDEIEVRERAVELPPFLYMLNGKVEKLLCQAHAAGRQRQATVVGRVWHVSSQRIEGGRARATPRATANNARQLLRASDA
jgi:hypothetical protein